MTPKTSPLCKAQQVRRGFHMQKSNRASWKGMYEDAPPSRKRRTSAHAAKIKSLTTICTQHIQYSPHRKRASQHSAHTGVPADTRRHRAYRKRRRCMHRRMTIPSSCTHGHRSSTRRLARARGEKMTGHKNRDKDSRSPPASRSKARGSDLPPLTQFN